MTFTIKKAKIPEWGFEITADGFHNIAPSVESAIRYLVARYGYSVKYRVIQDGDIDYKVEAIRYCEQHGIIEHHVIGNKMIYYTSFPSEHMTYKAVVDLDTWNEERTPMKRYYKAYKALIGGRYQANYMA